MSVARVSRSPGRSRRRFRQEFKTGAVALALEGDQSIASVARVLGVGDANLGNWVRQARIDRGDWPTSPIAERAELVALRRENARLPMARDLLKRAAAFWPARVLTVPSLAASATRVMGPAPSAQTVRIIAQSQLWAPRCV